MSHILNMLNKNVLVGSGQWGFDVKSATTKVENCPTKVIKMPLDPELWSYLDPSQTVVLVCGLPLSSGLGVEPVNMWWCLIFSSAFAMCVVH